MLRIRPGLAGNARCGDLFSKRPQTSGPQLPFFQSILHKVGLNSGTWTPIKGREQSMGVHVQFFTEPAAAQNLAILPGFPLSGDRMTAGSP